MKRFYFADKNNTLDCATTACAMQDNDGVRVRFYNTITGELTVGYRQFKTALAAAASFCGVKQ